MATAHVVADLALTDLGDLPRAIEAEPGLKAEEFAFISPPRETNAYTQRVNETKDSAWTPVRWNRHQSGKARDGEHVNLARKHDALEKTGHTGSQSRGDQPYKVAMKAIYSRRRICRTPTWSSSQHTTPSTRQFSRSTSRGQR